MLPEELEELAAEMALGSLSGQELVNARELFTVDPQFAAAVRRWDDMLFPLTSMTKDVPPPPHVRARIMNAIGGGEVIKLQRQLSRWKMFSGVSSALAAALAALVIWTAQPEKPARYVAVLQPETQGPAFIATVDVASGMISVRRVQAESQAGKSYELWAVGDGRDKPQSLGLIDDGLTSSVKVSPATILAVSLEPAGGSPTGQPTGPVLFQGKLVKTE